MRPLAFALFFHAALAFAAEPETHDLKKLERIDGPSFRPTDKQYPAELAAAGVQGEALVIVPLTEQGKSDGAILGASSRSEKLDQIAVDLLKSAKFEIKEAPAKGWKAVVVPVGFFKDSIVTLKAKTCAEFNTDLAYETATFPERPLRAMRVFEMLTGVLYIGSGAKASEAAQQAKRAAAARQPTVDACKANPDRMFYATWQEAVKNTN